VLRRCYMFGRTSLTIYMTADTNYTIDTNYLREAMTVLKKGHARENTVRGISFMCVLTRRVQSRLLDAFQPHHLGRGAASRRMHGR